MAPAELLDLCLAENERRMAAYDPRLLRPQFMPLLVRFVRRFLRPLRNSGDRAEVDRTGRMTGQRFSAITE